MVPWIKSVGRVEVPAHPTLMEEKKEHTHTQYLKSSPEATPI